MNVLLNTTTLNKGGALQACASFIQEALKSGEESINWCFAISRIALNELERFEVDFKDYHVEIFDQTPAKCSQSRKRLKLLEHDFAADVVFTFFGPAYVKFQAPHLCGVADGWVTHSSFLAFKGLGISRNLFEFPLRILHKAFWYRTADAWALETEVAKAGLIQRLCVSAEKVFVIPNNCGQNYLNNSGVVKLPAPDAKIRILCLSAHYPQKNLEIIPLVARELKLKHPELNFEFVITLPAGSVGLKKIITTASSLGVNEHVHNVGPVAIYDGPALYKSCHISFLPSLLETFSANYPEAMAMGLPIVTTDLGFGRDVCKDAALYFKPKDPVAAAEAILELVGSATRWDQLVRNGKRVLKELPLPRDKYFRYLECLRKASLFGS